MDGIKTRGHAAALDAIVAMIRGRVPHAVLLVGSAGVGKTTLALDLAAGLLCTAPDPASRPCGTCRACRLVASEGHPDLHRLGPEGPGRQVVIGGAGSRSRGVRDLIAELALLPVEGGARVAIIESAQRMNEDAQAALLKTLEEPPAGVTLILCADAEEPLLPTIRSRCARLRLGPVGPRDVEAVLAEHAAADAPTAARLGRMTGGRPGLALAWARDPDALRARDELARVLLDLTAARPADRLAAIRAAVAGATAIARLTDPAPVSAPNSTPRGRARRGAQAATGVPVSDDPAAAAASGASAAASDRDATAGPTTDTETTVAATRTPAAERRRAAEAVVTVWTDVARDLALAARGLDASARDPRLADETKAVAAVLDPAVVIGFLDRLGRASVMLAGNVAPELVMDDLAIACPSPGGRVSAA